MMTSPARLLRAVCAAAALSGALVLAACAGAPMDMSAGLGAGQASASRSDVRQQAGALRSLVDSEGWTLTGGAPLMSRLIRGAGSGEGALARYLDAAPEPVSATLMADASRLTDLTRQTAQAALAAAGETGAQPDRLAVDLAAVENALGAVRRASRFFAAAISETDAEHEALNQSLIALQIAEHDLALAADALAERRWALRTGAVS